MKTKKQIILDALRKCETKWIINSFNNPNKYMNNINLALHKIVLRERGINI